MTKRLITERQERIFRACHHYFDGLSQAEAAMKLHVSQQTISNTLKQVEKVLPEFFPLLTKLEIKCYHLYAAEGWDVEAIAEYLNTTPNSVYKALQRARDKGMCFTEPRGRVLSYSPEMDDSVKERF